MEARSRKASPRRGPADWTSEGRRGVEEACCRQRDQSVRWSGGRSDRGRSRHEATGLGKAGANPRGFPEMGQGTMSLNTSQQGQTLGQIWHLPVFKIKLYWHTAAHSPAQWHVCFHSVLPGLGSWDRDCTSHGAQNMRYPILCKIKSLQTGSEACGLGLC